MALKIVVVVVLSGKGDGEGQEKDRQVKSRSRKGLFFLTDFSSIQGICYTYYLLLLMYGFLQLSASNFTKERRLVTLPPLVAATVEDKRRQFVSCSLLSFYLFCVEEAGLLFEHSMRGVSLSPSAHTHTYSLKHYLFTTDREEKKGHLSTFVGHHWHQKCYLLSTTAASSYV